MVERYFGKYQASVVGNSDPHGQGRINVRVPEMFGDQTLWAEWAPSYTPGGAMFVAPPIGTQVLIEFLAGDPSAPVWCGHFLPDVSDIVQGSGNETVALQSTSIPQRLSTLDEGEPRIDAVNPIVQLTFESSTFTVVDGQCTFALEGIRVTFDGGGLPASPFPVRSGDTSSFEISTRGFGVHLVSASGLSTILTKPQGT